MNDATASTDGQPYQVEQSKSNDDTEYFNWADYRMCGIIAAEELSTHQVKWPVPRTGNNSKKEAI